MQGMLVNLSDVDLVLHNCKGTQSPTKIRVPAFIKIPDKPLHRRPTALHVTPKGRPITLSCHHFIHWLCKYRSLRQSPLLRDFCGKLESLRRRSEGVKPIELCLRIARTVMRRCICQAVCRHDPIKATTPDPVIDIPVLLIEIHKLDSSAGRNQKTLRGLGNITPVMKPVSLHIRGELLFHFPGPGVPSGVDPTMTATGQWRRPYETSHNQKVLRGLVS